MRRFFAGGFVGWFQRANRTHDRFFRASPCVSLAFSIAAAAASQGLGAEPTVIAGRAMGTTWQVSFVSTDSTAAPGELTRVVAERLEQLEQIFSTYRPQSELSRFNASTATDWQPVSPELAAVAEQSRRISELTAGAFDVTVHPLVQLWGFGAVRRSAALPSPAEIARARAFVDWRGLEIRTEPPALRKRQAAVGADFSSLAKGYASDAVSALLRERGLVNHLVLVGGDVKTGGAGPTAQGWPIAIERPLDEGRAIETVLALAGEALSTSGDYRNFFAVNGRRYGHILDPRTGEPVAHGLAAVSVVSATCAESSALATALFVLGPDDGWRLAMERKLAALFFVREGLGFTVKATPEFERVRRR